MKLSVRSVLAKLRKLLPLVGLAIVAVEIYIYAVPPVHVLVLALGVLMMYIGAWRPSRKASDRRANSVLRAEIEHFIELVRALYGHRTNGDSAAIHETKAALRRSVERIIKKAALYRAKGGQDEDEESPSDALFAEH